MLLSRRTACLDRRESPHRVTLAKVRVCYVSENELETLWIVPVAFSKQRGSQTLFIKLAAFQQDPESMAAFLRVSMT